MVRSVILILAVFLLWENEGAAQPLVNPEAEKTTSSSTGEKILTVAALGGLCGLYGLAAREIPVTTGILWIVASPLVFNSPSDGSVGNRALPFAGMIALGIYDIADRSYATRWRRCWINTAALPVLGALSQINLGHKKKSADGKNLELVWTPDPQQTLVLRYRF